MKRLLLLFIVFSLFINSSFSQDKAFHKRNITISLGAGFGLYGTKIHEDKDSLYYTNGTTKKATAKRDKNDGAFSGVYPITVEFAVTNWLGLGLRYAYSKYVAQADSTNNHIKPSVGSSEIGIVANLHFIKTARFDMPVSINCGYSNFKYKTNDAKNGLAKATGINYSLSLVPRIYFGNHIGMYFNIGYAGVNYNKVNFSNSDDSNLNDNDNTNFSLKANGINMGLGLIVKI